MTWLGTSYFADLYHIPLRPDAARPSLLRVQVGLRDFEQETNLPASDGQPVIGDYPTDWWAAGEVIVDDHSLVLPPDMPGGNYHFAVGLYRLSDGVRLPVTDTAGNLQPDGRIVLQPPIQVSK